MLKIDQILVKADGLARRCAGDGVPDNLLAMVLAHLRRHREIQTTLLLLSALPQSSFGRRTASTRRQFTSLKRHVGEAISSLSDWEEAAWIVGWARRLARSYGDGARRQEPPR